MKHILSLLIAFCFIFSTTNAFAQNYAIVTINKSPSKKFYATEFGYRKMAEDVIVYYAKPQNGRLMQGKDDITIKTEIGTIYFDSDRKVIVNKENPEKSFIFECDGKNLVLSGNLFVKFKRHGRTVKQNCDTLLCKVNNSNIIYIESNGKSSAFYNGHISMTTATGDEIIFGNNNNIIVKKGKYAVDFNFDLNLEQAYCFVN